MHVRLTSSLAFAPDSPEKVEAGALESQVLLLSAAVRQDPVEFIKHLYGSHAVRTLLHVLAGCVPPPRIDTRPGTQRRSGPSCVGLFYLDRRTYA